ncbi:MAG TPA: hypothetical protein VFB37_09610 [Steroidobacteraceae bacterium]|nr:hypothetical protein [Steroidobacteraceae bacterium]
MSRQSVTLALPGTRTEAALAGHTGEPLEGLYNRNDQPTDQRM